MFVRLDLILLMSQVKNHYFCKARQFRVGFITLQLSTLNLNLEVNGLLLLLRGYFLICYCIVGTNYGYCKACKFFTRFVVFFLQFLILSLCLHNIKNICKCILHGLKTILISRKLRACMGMRVVDLKQTTSENTAIEANRK